MTHEPDLLSPASRVGRRRGGARRGWPGDGQALSAHLGHRAYPRAGAHARSIGRGDRGDRAGARHRSLPNRGSGDGPPARAQMPNAAVPLTVASQARFQKQQRRSQCLLWRDDQPPSEDEIAHRVSARGHGPRRASRGRGLVDTVGRRSTPQARLLPRGRGRRRSDAERARQGADGRQDRPRSRRPLGRLRHDARSPAAAGNREGRPWRAGAPSRACPHRGGTGREPCTSRFANSGFSWQRSRPSSTVAAAKAMVR